LPFGFVNFYPLQVLLHKNDGLFIHATKWLSPVVAVIMLGVTAICWRAATRGYESAGS
jgi:ABC-2 type transport system permease protein